ncbi:MAG: TlpA family protein disulfide reductase [Planctomycetaceae bacterium]|nr:TlpA family protein disulfide reductase [Planctomycetaceae bacterium]
MKKHLAFLFVLSFVFFIRESVAQTATESASPQYTAADLLNQKPRVKNIDCDYPTPEEIEKCTASGFPGGWVVKAPDGTVLRTLLSLPEKRLQIHFYKNGIEVFRQVIGPRDSKQPNEFRWMNHAGTRWGIDEDLDSAVDRWKIISAEEVSMEAVAAFVSKDTQQFLRLTPNPTELTALGLGKELESQVRQKVGKMGSEFAKAVQGLRLSPKAEWLQFNGGQPGIVPASKEGNSSDIIAYENVSAIVRDGENLDEIKQVILGTIVKVGENNWRLIGVPHLDDPNSPQIVADYTFFAPSALADVAQNAQVAASDGDEISKLIEKIIEKQGSLQAAPLKDREAIHEEILELMLKSVNLQPTLEDQDQWIRAAADWIDGGVRANEYPLGPQKLEILFGKVKTQFEGVELAAYVKYKQIMAAYYQRLHDGEDDLEVQLQWRQNLEKFIEEYGKTDGAARAMLELANYYEMMQKENEAVKWYKQLASEMPQSDHGKRAAGAVRRITSVGKVVPFKSKTASGAAFDLASLKGNPVVLYFWDSYTATETASLRQVANSNKELKIVSINVDDRPEMMKQYLEQNPMPASFIQVFDSTGGISLPGQSWGLQIPPMMVLIDAEGKVVRQNITGTADLVKALEDLK